MNLSEFWTAERIALLEQRWEEGATCKAIAAELKCSKNAVVGKVHRIGLVPRVKPTPKPPRPADAFEDLKPSDCRWPIGHPGELEFHFCGERALPAKPYCADHAAIAYAKMAPGGNWSPERKEQHVARMRLRFGAAAE